MSIGARIRAAREAAHMTQSELGSKCGTTKQTIFKYENGIVTNIPLDRLELIAKALNIDEIDLMGWSKSEKETLKTLEELHEGRPPIRAEFAVGIKKYCDERTKGTPVDFSDIPEDHRPKVKLVYKLIKTYKHIANAKHDEMFAEYVNYLDEKHHTDKTQEKEVLCETYDLLNDEGKHKLTDYALDLLSSGNYSNNEGPQKTAPGAVSTESGKSKETE